MKVISLDEATEARLAEVSSFSKTLWRLNRGVGPGEALRAGSAGRWLLPAASAREAVDAEGPGFLKRKPME